MGKTLIRTLIALLALVTASFAVNVSVSSPSNGATVSSPTTIKANASSGYPITGWRIYVDGNTVYSAGSTGYISAGISMSGGTHSVVVRAWDSTGAYGSANMTLSVGSGGTPTSGSGPTAPSYATVYSHIENRYPTGKCSSPSCSGGVGSVWNYYAAPYQTSPSLDGASSMYYINGPKYTDDLFWYRIGTNTSAANFLSDFWVYTDGNAPTHAEALEFDLVQVTGGRKYNFSTECNYWTKTWDTWNEATQHWIHSNAYCQPFKPYTWHHVQWRVQRYGSQTHYLSVTVDGWTQNISSSYAYQPAPGTSWSNGAVIFQVQQDLNGNGGSYKSWVDKATVYAW